MVIKTLGMAGIVLTFLQSAMLALLSIWSTRIVFTLHKIEPLWAESAEVLVPGQHFPGIFIVFILELLFMRHLL